jgi:hypothetical protein
MTTSAPKVLIIGVSYKPGVGERSQTNSMPASTPSGAKSTRPSEEVDHG